MSNDFINNISRKLQKDLPGARIQYQMAPSIRYGNGNPVECNKGAVLILLYPEKSSVSTILIKRSEDDGPHSGQISFPGGRSDPGDKDLFETALREAEEEIGIKRNKVIILGSITPLYIPPSNIEVLPVIAYSKDKPVFQPSKKEVNFLISVEMEQLKNPKTRQVKKVKYDNREVLVPYYNIDGNHIWGATAMILSEFLEVIKNIPLNFV